MSFSANILNVMVASPGDVQSERETITQELYKWNAAHGPKRQLFLQPLKWETHSSPQLGAHPQHIINDQLLREADVVVGIFGTRIGTATPEFVSGTVEEIKRHASAGKLVMLYFSTAPVDPNKLDLEQWKRLVAFKEECRTAGLFFEYNSAADLESKFGHHLAIELNKPKYLWLEAPAMGAAPADPELTDEEIRLLLAASNDPQGSVIVGSTMGGYFVQTNHENFVEDSPRSEAQWKKVISRLDDFGYLEHESNEIYRITEEGYKRADAEVARRPLEVELKINGPADKQTLGITTSKPITINDIEFLTSSEAYVAGRGINLPVNTHADFPIPHSELVKLHNTPRPERNNYDHSGPGKLRLSITASGKQKKLILPVMLMPQIINSTQYIALTGAERFELSA